MRLVFFWLLSFRLCVGSCQATEPARAHVPTKERTQAPACELSEVTRVSEILKNERHPCFALVKKILSQTVELQDGLGTLLTVNEGKEFGMLLTARHVTHDYFFAAEGTEQGGFGDLINLDDRKSRRTKNSRLYDGTAIQLWRLLSPNVTREQLDSLRPAIAPKQDYDLYVYSRRGDENSPSQLNKTLKLQKLALEPFQQKFLSQERIASGKKVILIGKPRFSPAGKMIAETQASYDEGTRQELAVTIGMVMNDDEAKQFTNRSFRSSELRPHMLYDAESDIYVKARSAPGFSGGGVFDLEGNLVAVTSLKAEILNVDKNKEVHATGAVRLNYIRNELESKLKALPENQRLLIEPWTR